MQKSPVAILVAGAICIVSGISMVVLNLGGHAGEPAITALFSASGTAVLLLVGAGYVRPGG